jgi:ABC-type Na+ efflux pump permease subunit
MRDVLFIAWHDVKLSMRLFPTWLWTFLMPPVFFYFLGMIGGGDVVPRKGGALVVAASATERDSVAMHAFRKNLEKRDYRIMFRAPEVAKGERVLVVPDGFSAKLLAGEKQTLLLRHKNEGLNAEFDEFQLKLATYETLAQLALIHRQDAEPSDAAFAEIDARPRRLTVTTESAGRLRRVPSGAEQAVPGTMVMFTMLVLLTVGASMLVHDRVQGRLKRLASAPISRGAIVTGKCLARWLLALIQIGFAMLTGAVAFGVHWGPNVWAIGLVLAAYAAAVSVAAMLLANWARTPAQVIGVAVMASNTLGALSGCMWPIEVAPEWAQKLALVFPPGWAMDAIHRLMSFALPASSVAGHFVALCATAVALGWVVARRLRFE